MEHDRKIRRKGLAITDRRIHAGEATGQWMPYEAPTASVVPMGSVLFV